MNSYIIEFSGEFSDVYKKSYLKKTINFLWITVLSIFVILTIPLIIIGIKFDLLLYALILIGFILFVCLAVPIGMAKTMSISKALPVKVIIENDEIAALNSEQIFKLNSQSSGMDSLSINGYFITNIKSIFEVVKVVDYGEWYGIYFNSRHVFTDYICQKDLITKGTIEEFEKLFEGKIERKTVK